MMPGVHFALKTFDTKPLSITDIFACNTQLSLWKGQMAEWSSSTASKQSTENPLNAILGPVSVTVGAPHDMPGYCGYTLVFNILDHPAATISLKEFNTSAERDAKELEYRPLQSNPYDSMAHEMCKSRLESALSRSLC